MLPRDLLPPVQAGRGAADRDRHDVDLRARGILFGAAPGKLFTLLAHVPRYAVRGNPHGLQCGGPRADARRSEFRTGKAVWMIRLRPKL